MVWVLVPFLGYSLGSFPTGVVISRRRFGQDVRQLGTGNIGAANVLLNFGWRAGALTFLVDFLKGYFSLRLALYFSDELPWLIPVVGIAVVAGHCYSMFLKFSGGKGVATSLGCLAAVLPYVGNSKAPAEIQALMIGMATIVLIRHRSHFSRWLS